MKLNFSLISQTVVFSVAFCLILMARPAHAFMSPNVSFLERAQTSDLILAGTIQNIAQGRAQFAIERNFKGDVAASVVEVAPVEVTSMASRIFREGETVVLFLKRAAPLTIMDDGWASLTYTPQTKMQTFEAIETLLKLPPIAAKESLARAMFGLATSENPILKSEARRVISNLPFDRDNSASFEKELTELLRNPDADVKQTALRGLRFQRSQLALPLIVAIARGDHETLIDDASLALATYETPATDAILVDLTRHPNPEIRIRAMIDVGNSNDRTPAAKAALVARLDDADERVRALAPSRFIGWLREGKASEVVPRIIEMLDDPSAQVQLDAARTLGESADTRAVAPLFAVLKRPDLPNDLERATVSSLEQIYSRLDTATRPPVTDELGLIAAFLRHHSDFSASSAVDLLVSIGSPAALEITRETARNHPDSYLREHAQRALDQAAKASN